MDGSRPCAVSEAFQLQGSTPARYEDAPETLAGVSPSVLSEIQTLILPFAMVFGALGAKIIYLDLVLRSSAPVAEYLGAGILAAIVSSIVARRLDLNSPSSIVAGENRARHICVTVSLSFAFLLALFYLLKISDQYSRVWFVVWFSISLGLLLVGHLGILLWARLLRAERRLMQRIAVYGTVELAEQVLHKLFVKNPNLVLAGVFSDDAPFSRQNVRVVGGMRALIEFAQRAGCDRVILALPHDASREIREAVDSLEVLPIEVHLSPNAMTLPCELAVTSETGGLVLLGLQRRPLSARDSLLKTAIDYIVASFAIVALLPLMVAIAIAIKLDSRGPIFFVQSRHGYNHRIIRVIKFRTMTVAEDGQIVTQAIRGDKRVTRIGRLLRRRSLDELPQLINVIRGDLSLVGPRPHAVIHNEAFDMVLNSYPNRLKVKPGITGWAQVNGCRGETKTVEAMRRRLDLDLYYIKHWSLWLDVKILARTAFVPFSSANVY